MCQHVVSETKAKDLCFFLIVTEQVVSVTSNLMSAAKLSIANHKVGPGGAEGMHVFKNAKYAKRAYNVNQTK
jgi:hypothetical protein